jgi:GT2 family glycosyltransferase
MTAPLIADLVTVFHNDTNHAQHIELRDAIGRHEPLGGYRFIAVDNRTTNRGFARACNLGALGVGADAPIIGFLNPDLEVHGPFLDKVAATINDRVVIAGERFGKAHHELAFWGVQDWVCGAAFFVQRTWFEAVHGFDEQFEWAWEETDLIRQAQADSRTCRSIPLPVKHGSPDVDSPTDVQYKRTHFQRGSQRFYSKWGRR